MFVFVVKDTVGYILYCTACTVLHLVCTHYVCDTRHHQTTYCSTVHTVRRGKPKNGTNRERLFFLSTHIWGATDEPQGGNKT